MTSKGRWHVLLAMVWGALIVPALGATSARAAEKTKKVLVLGIDGCRPDALRKANAPNLKSLAEGGAYTYTAQNLPLRLVEAETTSGPGWASMLSGAFPDKHGWIDDVRRKRFNGRFPHFFARLKAHNQDLSTVSIITWPDIRPITTGADVNEIAQGDQAAADRAAGLLAKTNPDAMFVHLDDVDGAGHGKGFSPDVPAYIKAIEETDRRVGQIVAAVRGRPTYAKEDWLILVSSDHGGWGSGHASHSNVVPEIRKVFYIASGESAEAGEIKGQVYIVNVAATALAAHGSENRPGVETRRRAGRPEGLSAPVRFPPQRTGGHRADSTTEIGGNKNGRERSKKSTTRQNVKPAVGQAFQPDSEPDKSGWKA